MTQNMSEPGLRVILTGQQTIRFDPQLSLELLEVHHVRILNLVVSLPSSGGLWIASKSSWGKS